MASDYTTQKMIDRIGLKAMTSTSSGLSPQQIIDLANDELRSYLVPFAAKLREEWWVGATDYVVLTDSNGQLLVPDTVAQSMRTVSWNQAGVLTPLTRIEPENAFGYQPFTTNVPTGFQLRGNVMQVLPKAAGIEVHITGMLRPSQMVLTENACQAYPQVAAPAGKVLVASVPLEWQASTWVLPFKVDIINGNSPFNVWGSCTITAVDATNLLLSVGADYATVLATIPSTMTANDMWFSDPSTSPFASVPAELYALLEQAVVVTLHGMNGDKRLAGAEKKLGKLEADIKAVAAPRTTGNARPIVNHSAPGMRAFQGLWPRR